LGLSGDCVADLENPASVTQGRLCLPGWRCQAAERIVVITLRRDEGSTFRGDLTLRD